MGKLRMLGSGRSVLEPRVAVLKDSEPGSVSRRKPWAHLYADPRWKKLRRVALKRDGYVCQQTGVPLIGRHPAPDAPVVDHKIPHRGDPELFFDLDNLQSVSKEWHDKEKQSLEKRGLV